jgi:hypothetical protein
MDYPTLDHNNRQQLSDYILRNFPILQQYEERDDGIFIPHCTAADNWRHVVDFMDEDVFYGHTLGDLQNVSAVIYQIWQNIHQWYVTSAAGFHRYDGGFLLSPHHPAMRPKIF